MRVNFKSRLMQDEKKDIQCITAQHKQLIAAFCVVLLNDTINYSVMDPILGIVAERSQCYCGEIRQMLSVVLPSCLVSEL